MDAAIGDTIRVQVTKVTKQKISGLYVSQTEAAELTPEQVKIEQVYKSIEEESQKDIA